MSTVPPPTQRRAASEAAQRALLDARAAHAAALEPYAGLDLSLLDHPTRIRLSSLSREAESAAWSLVMLWQPRILSLVARKVRRHDILRPTAEDLRQDAITWAHELAQKWDPSRGRGWPGYLKLCLGRRLTDHHTRILIDGRRHTDRPLAAAPEDADGRTSRDRRAHIPEPVDPRPSPERALINRALAERIQQAPSVALLKLLTTPGRSLPQRGTLAAASGLLPALRRLLDAAPLTRLQRAILIRRMGTTASNDTEPVHQVASALDLTTARVKLLQRIALARLQQALSDDPSLANDHPRWPVEQVPLLTTSAPTAPPRPRRAARPTRRLLTTSSPPQLSQPTNQLSLLDWRPPATTAA